jgi:hypothetical protein
MNNCQCNNISLLTNKDLILDGVVLITKDHGCNCEISIINDLTLSQDIDIIKTKQGDI